MKHADCPTTCKVATNLALLYTSLLVLPTLSPGLRYAKIWVKTSAALVIYVASRYEKRIMIMLHFIQYICAKPYFAIVR
jgi:hypothetical protein